jgi:hypothetical protein
LRNTWIATSMKKSRREVHPPPRQWGRGTAPQARWKGRGPRRDSCVVCFFSASKEACDSHQAASHAPPPPRFATADASRRRSLRKERRLKAAYAPSPACAGADGALL